MKPDGWLDDGPEYIPDPDASQPDDWYVLIVVFGIMCVVYTHLF